MEPLTFSALPSSKVGTTEQMMSKAEELEASFLAEMLGHSGLGEISSTFDGGSGEAQFSSFLRAEQARLVVEGGGIGLAELIFNSMIEAEHARNDRDHS